MPGLVLELQKDALDNSINITDLVRKALVVARKLKITELLDWAISELNGYHTGADVPQYRRLAGEVRYFDPYRGEWCPVLFSDEELARLSSERPNPSALGELDSIRNNLKEKQSIYMPLTTKLEKLIMESMEINARPVFVVNEGSFHGIFDAVRNGVLEWALKLEEDGIVGKGISFSNDELEKANSITYNVQNFFGDVSNAQVQQATHQSSQNQTITVEEKDRIQSFINSLKNNLDKLELDGEKKLVLTAEIGTIEAQLKSPTPQKSILKESIFSMRNILESIVASAITSGLLSQIPALFG